MSYCNKKLGILIVCLTKLLINKPDKKNFCKIYIFLTAKFTITKQRENTIILI